MKKKLYFFYLILPLTIVFLSSCKPKDDEPNTSSNFDRKSLLENMAENLIIPSYQNFQQKAALLVSATTNFSESPNESSLSALQETWKEAVKAWNATEPFNYFGPIADSTFSMRVNNYPSDYQKIENNIVSSTSISKRYIDNLGSREKGLHAIEYLIFSREGNTAILETFATNAGNRKLYLNSLAENIKEKADNSLFAWQPEGKNYKETFLSLTGTDAGSSTNQLTNSLIMSIESIKNIKIGEALGKKNNGIKAPEKVEAFHSQYSIEIINSALDAIENTFKGKSGANDKQGFDDYLNHVKAKWQNDQLLSERILQQFQGIRSSVSDINVPLDEAVSTQTDKVDKAYNSLISLVSLVKAEMVSKLGLTITYSDNDGD